jgi:hypothetical protein
VCGTARRATDQQRRVEEERLAAERLVGATTITIVDAAINS